MIGQLVAYLRQSWEDLDFAVANLSEHDATTPGPNESSIAWTVGHVTNMADSWLNVRIQGLSPHPIAGLDRFRVGGSGEWGDWPAMLTTVREVRTTAAVLLDQLGGADMDRVYPYAGSIGYLRDSGLPLRYALLRIAAHHFHHVGEIRTIRARLGHDVPEQPNWGRRFL